MTTTELCWLHLFRYNQALLAYLDSLQDSIVLLLDQKKFKKSYYKKENVKMIKLQEKNPEVSMIHLPDQMQPRHLSEGKQPTTLAYISDVQP